ncbi:MAG: DUF5335 domain-containing protein [Pseudomonadota bacterium]
MPLVQLSRARWQAYLDRLSAALPTGQIEIEVTGLGLGAHVEAEWLPFMGISYDPHNDIITVIAQGVDHIIRQPRQIHLDHDLELLRSVEVIDAEGNHHILLFRTPLALPSA